MNGQPAAFLVGQVFLGTSPMATVWERDLSPTFTDMDMFVPLSQQTLI